MQHELTWVDVFLGLAAFAGAAAAFTFAFLSFFADREELTFVFGAAGLVLAFWSGLRMLKGDRSEQAGSPSA
jgi:hypothetical protein